MDEVAEVWMFVPDTDERFAISNYGHLKQVARKVSRFGKVLTIPDGKLKPLYCTFKDGTFGWKVAYDNRNRFFARNELLALFNGIPMRVDASLDAKLKGERDTRYEEWQKKKVARETPAE